MNYLKTFLPFLFGNKKGESLDSLKSVLDTISTSNLKLEESLTLHTLNKTLKNFLTTLHLDHLSDKDVYHLLNFLEFMPNDFKDVFLVKFEWQFLFFQKAVKAKPISVENFQKLIDFKNNQLSLYAVLNSDRSKKGVLFIRLPDGTFYKKENGEIWSIPILGLSGRGLPFHHSNGCTPMGVYSVDSVMPLADQNKTFGKHRRLKVNFIDKSPNEKMTTDLLPLNQTDQSWWLPCVLARELGRSLLRIHGTGRKNYNPFSSYYPFVPTSGCLATLEANLFGIIDFDHQRLLLDALLAAMGLALEYENEPKIHGLLYVVEFDDNLSQLKF